MKLKKEIVARIAEDAGITTAQAEKAYNSLVKLATEELIAGQKFYIAGIGTFSTKDVAEREGRNPATGEPMTIAARKRVSVSVSKTLKDSVNNI